MSYEFFKETLVSKYIKYLLSKTPLPQYPYIYDNQYMIEGNIYTYKEKILLCTYSGIFSGIRGGESVKDYLTVSDGLSCNDPFNTNGRGQDNLYLDNYTQKYSSYSKETATSWMTLRKDNKDILMPLAATDTVVSFEQGRPAEFRILHSFLDKDVHPNITQVYTSTSNTYDSETHRALGEYLRYLKNAKNINLMGLYNCFNYTVTKDLIIDPTQKTLVYEKYNTRYKVVLVPIKFNRTYTIAIDCNSKVMMHPVFYSDGSLLKDYKKGNYLHENILSSEDASKQTTNLVVHNVLQFRQPKTYTIRNVNTDLLQCERDLHLAIQLPTNNDSSIVVLEGDFVNNTCRVISDVSVLSQTGGTVERLSDNMSSNLSLLSKNDGAQHPFADKLIEYLCSNTIDSREVITENVSRVVSDLGNYHYGYDGQWTDYLRYTLYNRFHDYEEGTSHSSDDILGYVDSDIENILKRGHMKRES